MHVKASSRNKCSALNALSVSLCRVTPNPKPLARLVKGILEPYSTSPNSYRHNTNHHLTFPSVGSLATSTQWLTLGLLTTPLLLEFQPGSLCLTFQGSLQPRGISNPTLHLPTANISPSRTHASTILHLCLILGNTRVSPRTQTVVALCLYLILGKFLRLLEPRLNFLYSQVSRT
ncbi:hypothetical protein B296_00027963 [Ensete ventricosum]|uniref:Uncharacterized protein n=1 Tax=Ensete ventricosum TaxID=4639 RepID=A0A426YSH7_ENSVE|nr:hypothetical protein B296_00027963 [Ensete ventricosum]